MQHRSVRRWWRRIDADHNTDFDLHEHSYSDSDLHANRHIDFRTADGDAFPADGNAATGAHRHAGTG
jgi:hypothetical protein